MVTSSDGNDYLIQSTSLKRNFVRFNLRKFLVLVAILATLTIFLFCFISIKAAIDSKVAMEKSILESLNSGNWESKFNCTQLDHCDKQHEFLGYCRCKKEDACLDEGGFYAKMSIHCWNQCKKYCTFFSKKTYCGHEEYNTTQFWGRDCSIFQNGNLLL